MRRGEAGFVEEFVTGYCRVLDGARTVTVDTEEREADCAYPDCPYSADCPIGKQIKAYLEA